MLIPVIPIPEKFQKECSLTFLKSGGRIFSMELQLFGGLECLLIYLLCMCLLFYQQGRWIIGIKI